MLVLIALAAGFRIDTHSSRAAGMGTAVSALVDDASANFYNPAGLAAQGKGFEVQLGDTLIFPSLTFTEPNGNATSSVFSVSPPPHLYARAGLFENVGIGIGVFSPFGASGNWPGDWVGQFRARESSLQTFDFNLNIAWRPVPRLSLGAGVNVVRGTVLIARNLDFVDSQGAVTLGGGAWGVGWNGGVQVEMIEKMLTFAGSVRSGVDLNFTGAAHFEKIPPEFQSRIYDQKIQANISLPMVAQFGLGARPLERLRLGLDVTFVGWSSFQELRVQV
jgi:long-chain fatty acid transport protein